MRREPAYLELYGGRALLASSTLLLLQPGSGQPAIPCFQLDADASPARFRSRDERRAASQERVQHGVSDEAEQLDASPRQLHGKRRGMARALPALPVEGPQAVGPVHELLAADIRAAAARRAFPMRAVENDDQLHRGDDIGGGGA